MSVAATLRTAAALCLAGMTAACGFSPLYADRGSAVSQTLSTVTIERIESDRQLDSGYFLEQELNRLLGNGSASPEYKLRVRLDEELDEEAITRQADIVRLNIEIDASFVLSTIDGEVVHTGRRSAISSYTPAPSLYATEQAKRNAAELAARSLAQDIELDLVLYFKGLSDRM